MQCIQLFVDVVEVREIWVPVSSTIDSCFVMDGSPSDDVVKATCKGGPDGEGKACAESKLQAFQQVVSLWAVRNVGSSLCRWVRYSRSVVVGLLDPCLHVVVDDNRSWSVAETSRGVVDMGLHGS